MRRALPCAVLLVLACAAPAGAAPGDLDQAFGTGGTVVTPVGAGGGRAYGVTEPTDGGIVLAGEAQPDESSRRVALARYSLAGDPLRSFGNGGVLVVPGVEGGASAIAPGPGGRLLVAGTHDGDDLEGLFGAFSPAGALLAPPAFGGFPRAGAASVAPLPDGGAIVAGSAIDFSGSRGEVRRLGPDGAPGRVHDTTPGVSFERFDAVIARADGSSAAAGTANGDDGGSAFELVRYDAEGHVLSAERTAFATGGAGAVGLAALPDGGAIAVGSVDGANDSDWALVRYRADGTPDPAFGDGGRVVTRLSSGDDRALAVAVTSSGKLVVAGVAADGPDATAFTVARYLSDGRLDTAFGDDGVAEVPVTGDRELATSVLVEPGGAVIAGGYAERDGTPAFVLARLLGDAAPPPLVAVDPGTPASPGTPIPTTTTGTPRFSIRLVGRKVGRDLTVRVRVGWPLGWRGRARILIQRRKVPRLLLAERTFRGTGGRGRTMKVRLRRTGVVILKRGDTPVRLLLLPAPL